MTRHSALRILFRHEGDDLTLVAALGVNVRAPASADTGRRQVHVPFYFELQGASGEVLYRRSGPSPFGPFFEVPTGEADAPFHYRSANDDVTGAFSLIVPNTDGARFVEVFATGASFDDLAISRGRFDLLDAPDTLARPGVGL